MTDTIYIEIDLSFQRHDEQEPFDEFMDRIVDELIDLGREADYVSTEATLEATVTMTTTGRSEGELIKDLSDLRTALHAAGCGTQDWNGHEITATRSRELAGV